MFSLITNNNKLMNYHEANQDIQYVSDMFACAQYVTNYLTKSETNMSSRHLNTISRVSRMVGNLTRDYGLGWSGETSISGFYEGFPSYAEF